VTHAWRIEYQSASPYADQPPDDEVHFVGEAEFLRGAAQSLANAGAGDPPDGPGESIDDEIRALKAYIAKSDLWLDAQQVCLTLQAAPMKGGKEHQVAFLPGMERVMKVADVRKLATESIFDYLSDLLLSNHYFDDDIRLAGAFEAEGRLFIVITQPYINGIHPEWTELRSGLARHQLRDPAPRSLGGNFIFDDELLGEVDVFDLHPNNVIMDATGWLNPIDAHFYFHDKQTRMTALGTLGLLTNPAPPS